jgi:hypothetical protein
MIIPVLVTCGGFLVFLYQCFLWLKEGRWTPLPASVILVRVLPTRFLEWLTDESTSWLGVKKIVLFVFDWPLSWFLVVLGFALLFLTLELVDAFPKKAQDKQKE